MTGSKSLQKMLLKHSALTRSSLKPDTSVRFMAPTVVHQDHLTEDAAVSFTFVSQHECATTGSSSYPVIA